MSHLTPTPGRPAAGAHRARIVADAVVSAYLNEITPASPRRNRARTPRDCAGRSPLTARARGRAVGPRRRTSLNSDQPWAGARA
jgi:hypothetical protein